MVPTNQRSKVDVSNYLSVKEEAYITPGPKSTTKSSKIERFPKYIEQLDDESDWSSISSNVSQDTP